MPTPEKMCPDQSSLPWALRIGMAQAEVPTSTKALATPARNRSASHSGAHSENPIRRVVRPTPMRPQRIESEGRGVSTMQARAPRR